MTRFFFFYSVSNVFYTSNGSVQVMPFSDRLEVWNPGTLPPTLTLARLRLPHGSVPGNPLLAESLYLTKYIERMGKGVDDMIERCRNAGLLEPEFYLTDGFVTIICRKPELALKAVTPPSHSTSQPCSRSALAFIGLVWCFGQSGDPKQTWSEGQNAYAETLS